MDWMAGELREAWQIVVRDILTQKAIMPEMHEHDWGSNGDGLVQVTAMTSWPDGSECGISVLRDDPLAERIAFLADGFQDAEVEGLAASGLSAVWPSCPQHPDTHPLQATVRDHVAVWICPASSMPVARIGHLA
jgi:hypothetical protein